VAILLYGVLAGVISATAMYSFRYRQLTYGWATEPLLAGVTLFAGASVKLLVEEMRASVAAFLLSLFLGAGTLAVFQVVPYVLSGGPRLALQLYLPFRDILTFLFMIQFPLQLSGYLSMVVYDGYHS
jgi:hypothetical protein